MESALLLRVLSRSSVCVMLSDTGAIVQAELQTPLTPRSHTNAQIITPTDGVQAQIQLGPYDLDQHRFTGCILDAELPEAKYDRVDYAQRSKKFA